MRDNEKEEERKILMLKLLQKKAQQEAEKKQQEISRKKMLKESQQNAEKSRAQMLMYEKKEQDKEGKVWGLDYDVNDLEYYKSKAHGKQIEIWAYIERHVKDHPKLFLLRDEEWFDPLTYIEAKRLSETSITVTLKDANWNLFHVGITMIDRIEKLKDRCLSSNAGKMFLNNSLPHGKSLSKSIDSLKFSYHHNTKGLVSLNLNETPHTLAFPKQKELWEMRNAVNVRIYVGNHLLIRIQEGRATSHEGRKADSPTTHEVIVGESMIMKLLFDWYKNNINDQQSTFTRNGKIIGSNETPLSLNIKPYDLIINTKPTFNNIKSYDAKADTIAIRVRECFGGKPFSPETGNETFFKIKKTTKMAKVFKAYATRKGIQGKINLLSEKKPKTMWQTITY